MKNTCSIPAKAQYLMRFVCLLTDHLPVRVEGLSNPALVTPIVILRDWDERVLDASPEAIATGVSVGDSRRRVEQVCPRAVILPAREAHYQAAHDQLRSSLLQFANAIETAELGMFFIEVSALARSFPSEESLAVQIIQQIDQVSALQPVLGLASNKFTALQAARQSVVQSVRIAIVPAGGERAFLDLLPLRALPDPPPEMLRRLNLFGINTPGRLCAVAPCSGRAAIWLGVGVLSRSGARDRSALANAAISAAVESHAHLHLPEPLSDRAMVLSAVERLASRIAQRLEESGYQALAVSLVVTTNDQREHTTGSSVKPPSSNADQLRRLGGRLLGKLTFETDVSAITLRAYPLREWHFGAQQLSLLDSVESSKWAQFRVALHALQKRFGEAVLRLASTLGPPVPLPIRVNAQADGVPLDLRWGRWSRRVTSLYEYWREQRAWWDQLIARDYYQIELGDGLVFTLFRDNDGQWFLDRRRS